MKRILILIAALGAFAASANEFDAVRFRGATDKRNPVGYRAGEKIVFRFSFEPMLPAFADGTLHLECKRFADDRKFTVENIPLDGVAPLQVETSLDRPGFVRYEVTVRDAQGNPVKRDRIAEGAPGWEGNNDILYFAGSAGVDVDELRQARPEPDDFDAFWARQKARLAAVPVKAETVEVEVPADKPWRLLRVKVDCAGPRPVFGWLMLPKAAKPHSLKAVMDVHGYGARGPQPRLNDSHYRSDRILFSVNAHGFDPLATGREPELFRDGIRTPIFGYAFSPYQNEYPEGSYFNGMALRVIRGFDYLKTLPEWNGRDLEVQGGSQGGFQSMLAAGLVDGLTEARPEVPWICDVGADAAGRLLAPWHIDYAPGLRYYDCVNMAKRAKCRVKIMRAGLGDNTCLPSGVACLYNALPPDRRSIKWVQGSRHGFVPPMPNQAIELPSGEATSAVMGDNVYTGAKLPE